MVGSAMAVGLGVARQQEEEKRSVSHLVKRC